jgi:hypothetical protein
MRSSIGKKKANAPQEAKLPERFSYTIENMKFNPGIS